MEGLKSTSIKKYLLKQWFEPFWSRVNKKLVFCPVIYDDQKRVAKMHSSCLHYLTLHNIGLAGL